MPTLSYQSPPPTTPKNRFALSISSIVAAILCIALPAAFLFIPDKDSGGSDNYNRLAFAFIAKWFCLSLSLLGLTFAILAIRTSRNPSNRSSIAASIGLFLNIITLAISTFFVLCFLFL